MPRAKGKILTATWWADERPIRCGREITPPTPEQWAALAHLTNREAAHRLGIGWSTAARLRREAGQARPEGGEPRRSLILGATTQLILQCHIQNGLTAAQIAELSGLGVSTIKLLCRWHGLRFRVGRPPQRAA